MLITLSSLTEAPRKPKRPSEPEQPASPGDRGTDPAVAKRIAAQQKRKKTIAAKQRADRQAAAAANKLKRKARLDQIKKDAKPAKPPGLDTVPAQIAHCMMAVHVKRGKTKEAAWNICRWAMTRYGYLKGPYRRNTKLPKATKQTQKGVVRSFQHGMEKKPLNRGVPGTGLTKFKKFKRMFKNFEPQMLPKGKG